MDAAGLTYERRDNCFAWLENVKESPGAATKQLRFRLARVVAALARRNNPLHGKLFPVPTEYYRSADTEWASDFMFRSQEDLARWMPAIVQHGCGHDQRGRDALSGASIPQHGGVNSNFRGEVITDFKHRRRAPQASGEKNWIKLYDKQGTVLRIETVINDGTDMKAYRTKENDPDGSKEWRKLRKGVADLHRRVELSQSANERYAEALAQIDDTTPLEKLAEPLCQRVSWRGRTVRALNPLGPSDAALLKAVNRGEFLINGFSNKDLRGCLHPATDDKVVARRQSSSVTRRLRLLRAHGLIEKVCKQNRYKVTATGRERIAALLAANSANTKKLLDAA